MKQDGRRSGTVMAAPKEVDGSVQPLQQLKVVVIGAGAAGLVAAREAIREGHSVDVLESGSAVGGVWIYSNEVETDPTGENALG